ncbi:hypothetical protein ACRALDRAFT_1077976 [Sodiomyces alcalophilus JCM 7366]|uniref:uncharacterized protein n=1 Tax=Sodiomyces alcalophilus JCM 7366 TaxID=591952 RepID=UPI0039B68EF3
MSSMSGKEFLAKVKNREIPVDSHERALRVAFTYLVNKAIYGAFQIDHGVFSVVEKLHEYGWTFGQGDLKFNRTLDIFYLAQMAAGIYRCTDEDKAIFPSEDDWEKVYDQHHHLFSPDAWKQYYSLAFLRQEASARFYRLPDLLDVPDSGDPLGMPRPKGRGGHFTKLPRWAHNVKRTQLRQPTLSVETMKEIALSTLQETISRLREDYPSVQPYSETQACFWLKAERMGEPAPSWAPSAGWDYNRFGYLIVQGIYDTWAWEAHYSPERWKDSVGVVPALEPDLDGTRKSEVNWCGWPDGAGPGAMAWMMGWDPELGSEEDILFLTAVAVKETEGVDASLGNLDYATRSHIFLAVIRAAFQTESEREASIHDLK